MRAGTARKRSAHGSPVLGSGLGKIGQAGDPRIVIQVKPRPQGRGQGRLILQRVAGRGALVSDPERPCQTSNLDSNLNSAA